MKHRIEFRFSLHFSISEIHFVVYIYRSSFKMRIPIFISHSVYKCLSHEHELWFVFIVPFKFVDNDFIANARTHVLCPTAQFDVS